MTSSVAAPGQSRVATVDEIRAHFPALERRHNGLPVAYFDGPGGTQVPRAVSDAVTDYLLHHNANTHWRYPSSRETDAILAGARETLADLLGASPDEVAFGANMTTLTFHLARGLGRGWGQGDEIVVTELDHHANIAPWRALERERGVTVRVVPIVPETGQLDWEALERALSGRTRLLAIGAASNALGTVTDVVRAVRLARDAGALTFVDAVHYAPHRLVDVRAIGCDFLACSAYKFYGPHVGVLYGRGERLGAVDIPKLEPAPETAPERVETGTLNHEGIAGAAAAVEFLASLHSGGSRRERLRAVYAELDRRGRHPGATAPRRTWGHSRRAGLRTGRRDRADTHGRVHPGRTTPGCRGRCSRRGGGLRVHRRFLCDQRGTTVRAGVAGRPRPRRVRGLHHGGRGGSVAGGRRAFGAGPLRLS